jgi:acyl-CoA synthetase (AMP-forming)/AMP-acid ligase II
MMLWDFLKIRMQKFANRIAFANSRITYLDLLALENKKNDKTISKCEGDTREDMAIKIIESIASNNVVVPISKEYGEENSKAIIKQLNEINENVSELAFIMFTSGTTGVPKGVMLTEENIVSNLTIIEGYFRLDSCKTICIARPLVHISVLVGELLYSLMNGLTIWFFEESFMPQRLASFLSDKRIDVLCGTPTMFSMLSNILKERSYPKVAAISGEVLDKSTVFNLSVKMPCTRFFHVYGLTEHSPRVSALEPEFFVTRAGSVGKILSGIEAQILNGELWVKSKRVMSGYLNNKTHPSKIENGWLRTGDLAHFDSQGFLYIDGRVDDLIIKAGLNVYPYEIEREVLSIKGIKDCIVYAERKDNVTKILLDYVGDIDGLELKRLLTLKLNPNIVPNKITKVEEIPRTFSGKKKR